MKSTRTTLFITVVITLLSVATYVWWYGAVESASAKAASLLTDITTQGQTKERITAARKALTDLESQEQQVNSYFVGQNDVVPFLEELQNTGTKLGTKVTVSSVSASTDAANPALTVVLALHGTFDHVMRTVGAIENAPYDIIIGALTLSGTAKDGWDASMTFTVGSGSSAVPTTSSTPTLSS